LYNCRASIKVLVMVTSNYSITFTYIRGRLKKTHGNDSKLSNIYCHKATGLAQTKTRRSNREDR